MPRHRRSHMWLLAITTIVVLLPHAALATLVTFDEPGLVHGTVVDTDFAALGITSITTTNIGGGPDLGVIFDSDFAGSTSDSDLLNPWAGGNLMGDTSAGNILIIQENSTGCGDDVCNNPDDEGSRPAGDFDIVFAQPQLSFGFDLFDVDNATAEDGNIVFYDGASSFTVEWTDLEDGSGSPFEVAGVVYGDNFANRIPEILPADVGLTQFDRIVINMGGSGAIDNLLFVPEPATGVLVLGGLALLGATRRRR